MLLKLMSLLLLNGTACARTANEAIMNWFLEVYLAIVLHIGAETGICWEIVRCLSMAELKSS